MSWWKFWKVGYDSSYNNLSEINNTLPMPKVKPPRSYGPGDMFYVNEDISEPVFAIVNSIMNDKKRWEFWAHGVKGGDYHAVWRKSSSASFDKYTVCTLKDTKTSTEINFNAVLVTYSEFNKERYRSKVYLANDFGFYIIDNTWMTKKEKEYVIKTLSMWWQVRIAKATLFYEGVQERNSIRSKALKDKLAKQERERLMKLFCKEENK